MGKTVSLDSNSSKPSAVNCVCSLALCGSEARSSYKLTGVEHLPVFSCPSGDSRRTATEPPAGLPAKDYRQEQSNTGREQCHHVKRGSRLDRRGKPFGIVSKPFSTLRNPTVWYECSASFLQHLSLKGTKRSDVFHHAVKGVRGNGLRAVAKRFRRIGMNLYH